MANIKWLMDNCPSNDYQVMRNAYNAIVDGDEEEAVNLLKTELFFCKDKAYATEVRKEISHIERRALIRKAEAKRVMAVLLAESPEEVEQAMQNYYTEIGVEYHGGN